MIPWLHHVGAGENGDIVLRIPEIIFWLHPGLIQTASRSLVGTQRYVLACDQRSCVECLKKVYTADFFGRGGAAQQK